MLKYVNIKNQLIKARKETLQELDVLTWVDEIFNELSKQRKQIEDTLRSSNISHSNNSFNFQKLDPNAVFHLSQIKKICVKYRLRFLDTSFFKGDYPAEAISEIRKLEDLHNTKLSNFKIIAPSKLFKTKKADDPMLFAPMGNGYFYLIHKWGNDLHPLRSLKFWPVKNVWNMGIYLFALSLLATFISYSIFFKNQFNGTYALLLFMFYLKGFVGWLLFFGISSGKNFSEYSWQSPYDKIC
ncbi:MAG: hypothetical protein ACK5H1_04955 [Tenacibaculum sp.]